MTLRVVRAGEAHLERWARLRAALWPDDPVSTHRAGLARKLAEAGERFAGFLAVDAEGEAGFAEAAIRFDHVNGCHTSPVAFLEGVYVDPAHRRRGVARALCASVAAWGAAAGCSELASDADLANAGSHAMHRALGFEETERVVFYRRPLKPA